MPVITGSQILATLLGLFALVFIFIICWMFSDWIAKSLHWTVQPGRWTWKRLRSAARWANKGMSGLSNSRLLTPNSSNPTVVRRYPRNR